MSNTSDKNKVILTSQSPVELAKLAMQVLSPDVLTYLPSHWSTVSDLTAARQWLIEQEADLFRIQLEDEAVGLMLVHRQGQKWHMGFMLLPEYWGLGIASSAVREIQKIARSEQFGVSLFAGASSKNISSRRVLEKCGFTIETKDGQIEARWSPGSSG